MSPPRVVHLSSHHNPFDNRIFNRECKTLAQAGYEVAFVVRNPRDEEIDGVKILGVRAPGNRLERVTVTAFAVFRRALKWNADVYHFHDPELIPWGFILRLLGKKVVYDVHEDFAQAAGVRAWIPGPLRKAVAALYASAARIAARVFVIVIAERYYSRTFPDAVPVLNYPHLELSAALRAVERGEAERSDRVRLVYVGNLSESRGALIHAAIAKHIPGSLVHMVGQGSPNLVERVREVSGDATIGLVSPDGRITWEKRSNRPEHQVSTVILDGIGFYVRDRVLTTLAQPWTAALAIFPYSEHYHEKELTKFFEYMAAGLPLVVSDFPVWRALVEPADCGVPVDPENMQQIVDSVLLLHRDPGAALEMGRRGRRAVEERFSWFSQAENLLRLYARLTGRSEATVRLVGEPAR